MLEIKNLTKIYKSKGGVEVKALDDVSTKFSETGMVFLLGKSGSGKSTLLNICGGLDTPTNGEIIVKKRSSIHFKQSDFDSYRNTFIGFIFQEYNVLEEFTVEENIALALELQGKEKDQKSIDELLEKVELKGYNNRKPNTLSGGQKQRLAIARALVKSPEIIMADEPTGALDSETGKQVFDTLKELSKNTLVIVVSHDRDFAEKYGDRIIELKDGKIISDVTKTNSNEFIETNGIEIKEYDKKESEFISSKFPLKHAIRIGLSSLKVKKVRLIMTILLCTIAFTMFGLLSTLIFYNRENTFKETLSTTNSSYIQLTKEYEVTRTNYFNKEKSSSYKEKQYGNFSTDEINNYIKKYGTDTFGAITVEITYNVQDNSIPYWVNSIYTYAYLEENNTHRKNMLGEYPKEDDEIAISSYMAHVIINSKIDDYNTGKTLVAETPKDLIGKKIKLREIVYTITGIVDSGEISSEYDSLKQPGKEDEDLYVDFMKELQDGLHLIAFVSKNSLSIPNMEYEYAYDNFSERAVALAASNNGKYNFDMYSNGYYSSYDKVGNNYEYLNFKDYTNLSDSQAIINYRYFAELINSTVIDDQYINELANSIYIGGKEIIESDKSTFKMFSYEEIKTKTKELYNLVKNKNIKLQFGMKLYNLTQGNVVGQTYEYEVVGVFIPESTLDNQIIVNDSVYQKLLNNEINSFESIIVIDTQYVDCGYYDLVYVPYNNSEEFIDMLWDIRSNEELDDYSSREEITGSVVSDLDLVDEIVTDFSQIFLWVGIVLAVFAVLLFSNFISVSISNKRKEIGILRAIGAKSNDVFKIFVSESVILSIICIVLSSIGTFVLSIILNNILNFGVFVFGISSMLTIILIALMTALIATFLPVNNAARKKPIDSIRTIS